MLNFYTFAQAQCVSILLEAALKEYTADWLKNAESVVRDETGRFAKKAASVGQNVSQVKESIEEAIKNPQKAKRKISSKLLKLMAKGLDKLVQKYPEFTEKLLDKMFGLDAQKARDRLADEYGRINPGLPNAIRPDPLPEPLKETLADILKQMKAHKGDPKALAKDLQRAFELAGENYNELIDQLNNNLSNNDRVQDFIKILGKIASASIPLSTFLAFTLGPEIALGLLMEEGLATIITNTGVGVTWNFVADKALEAADIEDPWVQGGVHLAVSVGATTGMMDWRGFYRAGVPKSAKLAKEAAKQVDVPSDLLGAEAVTFVTGGIGDVTGDTATTIASGLEQLKKDPKILGFKSQYFVPNTKREFVTQNPGAIPNLATFTKTLVQKGRNPDAVSLAAQIAAWRQKHPLIPITSTGYSGGGLINRECDAILREMGISDVKFVNVGTPDLGMFPTNKAIHISSPNDELNVFSPKNAQLVPSVKSHKSYYEDPEFFLTLDRALLDKSSHDLLKRTEVLSGSEEYHAFRKAIKSDQVNFDRILAKGEELSEDVSNKFISTMGEFIDKFNLPLAQLEKDIATSTTSKINKDYLSRGVGDRFNDLENAASRLVDILEANLSLQPQEAGVVSSKVQAIVSQLNEIAQNIKKIDGNSQIIEQIEGILEDIV
jgi:hypothetical protein